MERSGAPHPNGLDAKDARPCSCCKKPLCHSQVPLFYRVHVEQMALDMRNYGRLVALSAMFGSQQLAEAFSPSTQIAAPIDTVELLICQTCAIDPNAPPLLAMIELAKIPARDQRLEATKQ